MPLDSESGRIELSWTDNSNAEDGYKIERAYGCDGSFSQIDTVGANVVSYSDTGLDDNMNYSYRVRAYKNNQNSLYSNIESAMTSDRTNSQNITMAPGMHGLVGYWKFDEGSGSAAKDSSWNNNTGTISGATWTSGHSESGLEFDGESGYVSITPTQDLSQNKMTISAWIKPNNFNRWGGLIYIYESALSDYLIIRNDGNSLQLVIEDDDSLLVNVQTPSMNDMIGKWVHVSFVQDGTEWKYYQNGTEIELSGTNGDYCTNHLTVNKAWIGRSAWSEVYWNGTIDDVQIYNRALSETEIEALYDSNRVDLTFAHGETGLENDGLVLYMPFEDGSGTHVSDWSGMNNDGVASSTTWVTGKYGGGIEFNGVSSYVQIPDRDVLDVSEEFTLSAWIKPDTTSGTHSIIRKSGAYVLYYSSELDFYNWADSSRLQCPTENTPEGQWSYVTAVWNGTHKIIYVNGRECVSEVSTDFVTNTNNVGIGATGEGETYFFDGIIDEAKIYNRALTEREVINVYQSGLTRHGIEKSTDMSGTYTSLNGILESFSGTMSNWNENVIGSITGSISNGEYSVSDATKSSSSYWIYDNSDTANQHQASGLTLPEDFIVEFKTTVGISESSEMGQIGIGLVDSNNLIRVFVGHSDGNVAFYRLSRQAMIEGSSNDLRVIDGVSGQDSVNWKIVKIGNSVTVYANNAYFYSGSLSSTPTKLSIAIGAYGGAPFLDNAYIDDIKLTPLVSSDNYSDTSATDNIAPNTPGTPTVTTQSDLTSLQIDWSDVNDNGNTYYYYMEAYDEEGNKNSIIKDGKFESHDWVGWSYHPAEFWLDDWPDDGDCVTPTGTNDNPCSDPAATIAVLDTADGDAVCSSGSGCPTPVLGDASLTLTGSDSGGYNGNIISDSFKVPDIDGPIYIHWWHNLQARSADAGRYDGSSRWYGTADAYTSTEGEGVAWALVHDVDADNDIDGDDRIIDSAIYASDNYGSTISKNEEIEVDVSSYKGEYIRVYIEINNGGGGDDGLIQIDDLYFSDSQGNEIPGDVLNVTVTSGLDSYNVDETSGNTGGTDSGWSTYSPYTDTGLNCFESYTYRVQAKDKAGNTGSYSGTSSGVYPIEYLTCTDGSGSAGYCWIDTTCYYTGTGCPTQITNCTVGNSYCVGGDNNDHCYHGVACTSNGKTETDDIDVGSALCSCNSGNCNSGYCYNSGTGICYSGITCGTNGWAYGSTNTRPNTPTLVSAQPSCALSSETMTVYGTVSDTDSDTLKLRVCDDSDCTLELCTSTAVSSGTSTSCSFTVSDTTCSSGTCTVYAYTIETASDTCSQTKQSSNSATAQFTYNTMPTVQTPQYNATGNEILRGEGIEISCDISDNEDSLDALTVQISVRDSNGVWSNQTVTDRIGSTFYRNYQTYDSDAVGTYTASCSAVDTCNHKKEATSSFLVWQDGVVTAELNQTSVEYGDAVNLSGEAYYLDTGYVTSSDVYVKIEGSTICSTVTETSGEYSCDFNAPNKVGNFNVLVEVLDKDTQKVISNTTVLSVEVALGGTKEEEETAQNVGCYEVPKLVQNPDGSITKSIVRICVWE